MDSQSNTQQPVNHSSGVIKYGALTRVFHWLGAVIILAAYVLVEFGDSLEGVFGEGVSAMWLHKSVGASFLIWTILRTINRFVSKAPSPVPAPKWQTAVAHMTHFGLYLSMLAMPMTGIMMSVYGGREVDVFGIFSIPVFVSPDRDMAKFFNNLHTDIIFSVMLLLVVAHVGAALYHQFVLKDNLIARMK